MVPLPMESPKRPNCIDTVICRQAFESSLGRVSPSPLQRGYSFDGSVSSEERMDTLGALPNLAMTEEECSPLSPGLSKDAWEGRRRLGRSAGKATRTHLDRDVSPGPSPIPSHTSSVPSSHCRYAEPTQTMIILDWDDTLFPTSEAFDHWNMPELTAEQERQIEEWREALTEFLEEACSLSHMVAIITNSRRPWVTDCVKRFAPDLLPIFMRRHCAPRVVYAFETLDLKKQLKSQCMNLRPVKHREIDLVTRSEEEYREERTQAKYQAMKVLATEFYSQYSGQTWKNILSMGDMSYEHDAVQELTFRRVHRKEKIHTKAIILPTEPTLSELNHQLKVSRHLLKAYVKFDGDLDLDLSSDVDPLIAIAEALRMPQLTSLNAWGRGKKHADCEELSKDLDDLEIAVHNHLYE